jgi:hypothetical protein
MFAARIAGRSSPRQRMAAPRAVRNGVNLRKRDIRLGLPAYSGFRGNCFRLVPWVWRSRLTSIRAARRSGASAPATGTARRPLNAGPFGDDAVVKR